MFQVPDSEFPSAPFNESIKAKRVSDVKLKPQPSIEDEEPPKAKVPKVIRKRKEPGGGETEKIILKEGRQQFPEDTNVSSGMKIEYPEDKKPLIKAPKPHRNISASSENVTPIRYPEEPYTPAISTNRLKDAYANYSPDDDFEEEFERESSLEDFESRPIFSEEEEEDTGGGNDYSHLPKPLQTYQAFIEELDWNGTIFVDVSFFDGDFAKEFRHDLDGAKWQRIPELSSLQQPPDGDLLYERLYGFARFSNTFQISVYEYGRRKPVRIKEALIVHLQKEETMNMYDRRDPPPRTILREPDPIWQDDRRQMRVATEQLAEERRAQRKQEEKAQDRVFELQQSQLKESKLKEEALRQEIDRIKEESRDGSLTVFLERQLKNQEAATAATQLKIEQMQEEARERERNFYLEQQRHQEKINQMQREEKERQDRKSEQTMKMMADQQDRMFERFESMKGAQSSDLPLVIEIMRQSTQMFMTMMKDNAERDRESRQMMISAIEKIGDKQNSAEPKNAFDAQAFIEMQTRNYERQIAQEQVHQKETRELLLELTKNQNTNQLGDLLGSLRLLKEAQTLMEPASQAAPAVEEDDAGGGDIINRVVSIAEKLNLGSALAGFTSRAGTPAIAAPPPPSALPPAQAPYYDPQYYPQAQLPPQHAVPPQAAPPQAAPPQAAPPQAVPPQAAPPQAVPPQEMQEEEESFELTSEALMLFDAMEGAIKENTKPSDFIKLLPAENKAQLVEAEPEYLSLVIEQYAPNPFLKTPRAKEWIKKAIKAIFNEAGKTI